MKLVVSTTRAPTKSDKIYDSDRKAIRYILYEPLRGSLRKQFVRSSEFIFITAKNHLKQLSDMFSVA